MSNTHFEMQIPPSVGFDIVTLTEETSVASLPHIDLLRKYGDELRATWHEWVLLSQRHARLCQDLARQHDEPSVMAELQSIASRMLSTDEAERLKSYMSLVNRAVYRIMTNSAGAAHDAAKAELAAHLRNKPSAVGSLEDENVMLKWLVRYAALSVPFCSSKEDWVEEFNTMRAVVD